MCNAFIVYITLNDKYWPIRLLWVGEQNTPEYWHNHLAFLIIPSTNFPFHNHCFDHSTNIDFQKRLVDNISMLKYHNMLNPHYIGISTLIR